MTSLGYARVSTEELKPHLCEERARAFEECDDCNFSMDKGEPIYFFSDGGFDAREGSYVCERCAFKIIRSEA